MINLPIGQNVVDSSIIQDRETQSKRSYFNAYWHNNKKKIRLSRKIGKQEYHLKNKERIREYFKEWSKKNPNYYREHYLKNIEKKRKYNKDYYLKNKESLKEKRMASYYKKQKEE